MNSGETSPKGYVFWPEITDVSLREKLMEMAVKCAIRQAIEARQYPPAHCYAWDKTGLMVVPGSPLSNPTEDWQRERRAEWDQAVAEYGLLTLTAKQEWRKAVCSYPTEEDVERFRGEAAIECGSHLLGYTPAAPAGPAANEGDEPVQGGLLLPVPFTKEDWQGKTVKDLVGDERFQQYYMSYLDLLRGHERGARYLKMFTVMTHVGRLEEASDVELDRILRRARNQPMTVDRLRRALEIAIHAVRPGEVFPTTASAFEFIAVVSEFAEFAATKIRAEKSLKLLLEGAAGLAAGALIVAINTELGIVKESSGE